MMMMMMMMMTMTMISNAKKKWNASWSTCHLNSLHQDACAQHPSPCQPHPTWNPPWRSHAPGKIYNMSQPSPDLQHESAITTCLPIYICGRHTIGITSTKSCTNRSGWRNPIDLHWMKCLTKSLACQLSPKPPNPPAPSSSSSSSSPYYLWLKRNDPPNKKNPIPKSPPCCSASLQHWSQPPGERSRFGWLRSCQSRRHWPRSYPALGKSADPNTAWLGIFDTNHIGGWTSGWELMKVNAKMSLQSSRKQFMSSTIAME